MSTQRRLPSGREPSSGAWDAGFLIIYLRPRRRMPAGQERHRTFRRKSLRPLRSSRNRLRQQEARRKLVSSVRHQCREARPMACRSAGPTKSLSVARRAIKARWRRIIHHSTLLSFGIVGDPAGSRTVCTVSHIMRNGTAISIYASFKTLSTGRKFARSFSFNAR